MRLVYDCEIFRCIPPKGMEISKLEKDYYRFGDGFQYAQGWRDFENLGISVICCEDVDNGKQYKFMDYHEAWQTSNLDIFPEFIAELRQDCNLELWGFNSFNFDDKLCQAQGWEIKSDYDLLPLIRRAAYGSEKWEDCPKNHSYSLGKIAAANGMTKTGKGEDAPRLWQEGKYQQVISYCQNDCKITAAMIRLFEKGLLTDPNTGRYLSPLKEII